VAPVPRGLLRHWARVPVLESFTARSRVEFEVEPQRTRKASASFGITLAPDYASWVAAPYVELDGEAGCAVRFWVRNTRRASHTRVNGEVLGRVKTRVYIALVRPRRVSGEPLLENRTENTTARGRSAAGNSSPHSNT
jgi:hypothetical protein